MTRASRARIIERLKTIGVSDRLRDGIDRSMVALLKDIARLQHDAKARHYALFVFTAEAVDDGGQAVTQDLFSSMEADVVIDFVEEWLAQAKAARGRR